MNEGIFVNGAHSYKRFGLRLLSRNIGSPPRDDHTERVPYSSVTYDYDELYGKSSYGERTLTYRFELLCFDREIAQSRVLDILDWLGFSGRLSLYDALFPSYHFEVRRPEVSVSEKHGVYTFDVSFKAAPELASNLAQTAPDEGGDDSGDDSDIIYPDVNGDGTVNSIDASLILQEYSSVSTGGGSILTDEQKLRADANRDGKINSVDVSYVLKFYSDVQTGKYENSPEGWKRFLKETYGIS